MNVKSVSIKSCFLIAAFLVMISCTTEIPSEDATVKVILDTDMGSDCDDVGALAMLNEYAWQGKAEILGVIYSSGKVAYGAGIIDAINRYYGHNDIPIGASHDSLVGDPRDKMLAEKLAKDTAAFGNRIIKNTDAPEQSQLIRKILVEEPNNSVVYVTIGHTKALFDLLNSEPDTISPLSGMELTTQKIKEWVALGALNALNQGYGKDWNFCFNGTAIYTKYLVENFPKPIYFVNAGADVMTGKSLLNTPEGNIVRTAYSEWLQNVEQKTLADQRPSWDLMTVLYAVEKPEKYFIVQNKGYLDFDIDEGCRWNTSDSLTQQYYVQQKNGYVNELAGYLNKMISKDLSFCK